MSLQQIYPDHPIKEFAEEVEPAKRKCLFCANEPRLIPTSDMTYKESLTPRRLTITNNKYSGGYFSPAYGWYSNAILHPTGKIKRFYLCPKHAHLTDQAWIWAKDPH